MPLPAGCWRICVSHRSRQIVENEGFFSIGQAVCILSLCWSGGLTSTCWTRILLNLQAAPVIVLTLPDVIVPWFKVQPRLLAWLKRLLFSPCWDSASGGERVLSTFITVIAYIETCTLILIITSFTFLNSFLFGLTFYTILWWLRVTLPSVSIQQFPRLVISKWAVLRVGG